jgi:DNA-binding XRE family transcriptional regulator
MDRVKPSECGRSAPIKLKPDANTGGFCAAEKIWAGTQNGSMGQKWVWFSHRNNWNICSCRYQLPTWQTCVVLSPEFAKIFGVIVRKHRKARFLTQEQLAERADLTPKMISLIERFQRNPSLNVAHSIAEGLGVPFWRLIKDSEDLRHEQASARRR